MQTVIVFVITAAAATTVDVPRNAARDLWNNIQTRRLSSVRRAQTPGQCSTYCRERYGLPRSTFYEKPSTEANDYLLWRHPHYVCKCQDDDGVVLKTHFPNVRNGFGELVDAVMPFVLVAAAGLLAWRVTVVQRYHEERERQISKLVADEWAAATRYNAQRAEAARRTNTVPLYVFPRSHRQGW
jgi:hypothetical protein